MSDKYSPVTASVDPSFISRAGSVFDASPRTVFDELIQNSRRAGATEVEIFLEKITERNCRIWIADNGRGIEDPANLLRLAASGWEEPTKTDEDPAGMGFFSLSGFEDVNVRSLDWTADLNPKVFSGVIPMTPEVMHLPADYVKGTAITFVWKNLDDATNRLRGIAEDAAAFCGLERVSIRCSDNPETIVITPRGFLEECIFVYTPEHGDYTIGVGGPRVKTLYRDNYSRVEVNFKGVQMLVDLSSIAPKIQEFDRYLAIRVDIHRVGDLRMVLPARDKLKHNDGLNRLAMDVLHAIYWQIATMRKGEHNFPYAVYAYGKELGYDIGEAKISSLSRARIDPSSSYTHLSDFLQQEGSKLALIKTEHDTTLLEALLSDAHLFPILKTLRILRAEKAYEGYSWYGAIPMLEAFVTVDGKEIEASLLSDGEKLAADDVFMGLVDELKLTLKFSDGVQASSDIDHILTSNYTISWWGGAKDDGIQILFRRDLRERLPQHWLSHSVQFITEVVFEASDEGDSSETQDNEFREELTAELIQFFGGNESMIRHLLTKHLTEDLPFPLRSYKFQIRFENRRLYIDALEEEPDEDPRNNDADEPVS